MNGCAIPYTPIAVDFWKTRQCPRVKFFFLTHGYVDQSCGLSHSWSMPIYCSPITRNILLSKFSIRPEIVHELELNVQHSIFLSDSEEDCIKVVLIASNYCPGSVMFFFEGYFGRILYTGNFRFCDSLLSQTPLQAILKNPIDVLYLDNTYFNSRCIFPTKESAMESIKEIIDKCYNRKILIALRSCGKEELLIYLSKYLKDKIRVNEERFKVLDILKEDRNFTVNNFISTSIDIIPFSDIFQKTNYDVFSMEPSICIVPTGLFTALGYNPFENQSNIFLVPYSNHSSYSEIIKFVSIVHPKSIVPLNKPVIDPLSGALMDRSNIDCFQEYLNKSPMHHYHIPQSVLKVMNQSSIPKSKRLSKCLKKARKSSEPIYVGSTHSDINKEKQKERRISVPKCLMTSALNRSGNEMFVKSNVNQTIPVRRFSQTTSQPMNMIKRCRSLDSFSSSQDCRPHLCQQSNLIDLTMSPLPLISNINFYQVSNLVRCHRARLCNPEQCRTVCHSKAALACLCKNYSNVQSHPRFQGNVIPQFRNVLNTNNHGGFFVPDHMRPTLNNNDKSTNNLCTQPIRKCSINTISNKLSAIGLSPNYSASSESKAPTSIDDISNNNVSESKVLKRCQNQSTEVVSELPPKKKWCNKFNTSQLDDKVSSENKSNFNPMRRRLGTTANPMDVGLNTIAKVPSACMLSNSNYGNLTNISSCSPMMAMQHCRNSMKVRHFNSQDGVASTSYLCQPVLPIDLSISKA